MAKNWNINPYYDDYSDDKNFHRVLYRPGLAVQARELTQQQTILQNQIARFANHVFQNGSRVTGAETFLNLKTVYLKLQPTLGGVPIDVTSFIGAEITGATSGTIARVVHAEASTDSDAPTLFLTIITGDSAETSAQFVAGEQIATGELVLAQITTASPHTGEGSLFSVNEGVFYLDGFFVFCNKQTLVLDKYTATPTYRIGLTLREEVITSNTDSSLLDPARESTNFQAIGADRYKISLVLEKKDLDFSDDVDNAASEKFIELLRVEDGVRLKDNKYPVYSELAKTMARRTFEESGNYTIKPFQLRVEDDPSDATLLRVGLEPGKAFVQGYEFETISPEYLSVAKARDTVVAQNREINAKYGPYCLVSNMKGFFNAPQYISVDLLNDDVAGVTDQTLYDAAKIGTARLAMISYESGTGANVIYRFYLNSMVFTSGSFAAVKSIWVTDYATQTYVDIDAAGISGTDSLLFDTDSPDLLFETPFNVVKTLKPGDVTDTSLISRRSFSAVSFTAGAGEISVSGDNTFFGGSGALSASLKRTHYICVLTAVTDAGATGLAAGAVVDFTSGSRTITLSSSDQIATFDIDDASFEATAKIIATVNLNVKGEKVKTSANATVTGITLSGGRGSLTKSDVYSIVSIIDTGDGDADVTDLFTLDTGQRDTHYDHAAIVLNTGESVTGPLDVEFDYFTHSGSGYFSVDSYAGIDYEDIPSYEIQSTGTTVRLSDVLDFRPRRTDGAATYAIDAAGTDMPLPETNVDMDIEYYIPRIDRIVLRSDLNFGVQSGQASLNPTVPASDPNAMALYDIFIPAYTFLPSDVQNLYIDNRRYTMRDIGSLARRIDRIEYYTALSLMEKDTKDLLITDDAGDDLFKNGILVDPFRDLSIGNTESEDFKASIDVTAKQLRCQADHEFYSLEFNADDSTDITQTNSGVTLEFEETAFIKQPLASKSISLNPFSVSVWQGDIEIAPQTDQWVDTQTRPVVIDSISASINTSGAIEDFPDQLYRYYAGGAVPVHHLLTVDQITAANGSFGFSNHSPTQQADRSTAIVSYATDQFLYDQIATLAKQTTAVIQGGSGDRVVDLNFIPYIRAQTINFVAVGMKPNTRLYVFFDDVAVNAQTTPAGGVLGGQLFTDANGKAEGAFALPNSDVLRFRTGQRILKLTDSASNDDDSATTISEAIFFAEGLLKTVEESVTSTRPTTIKRAAPADNRITTDPVSREQFGRSQTLVAYRDPVAQTFNIDGAVFPNGLFLSSVELFFQAKDTSLPVTVEIRPTVNGYPHTSKSVPFSSVTLNPNDVLLSDDGSVATKFTFKAPVYLAGGDYALVISANTENYLIFVGELGQNTIGTNQRITGQPYSGALFKSQNASVWVPELDEDITFRLNRCVFTTETTGEAFFEIPEPAEDQLLDSFEIFNEIIQPPGTSYSLAYKIRDNDSGLMDSTWNPVERNTMVDLSSRAVLDSSAGDTSMILRAQLSTTSDAVSPFIDEEGTNFVALKNHINNSSADETDATGGDAEAKYISRKVILRDGLDANGLKVYLNADAPAGTTIEVYAKVLAASDSDAFEDKEWVALPRVGSISALSTDANRIIEMEFMNEDLSYGDFATFKYWAVKIVMLSPATTLVPKIQDMRAIALTV